MRSIGMGLVSVTALAAFFGGCERDRPEQGEGTPRPRQEPGVSGERAGRTDPAGVREPRELEIELKAAENGEIDAEVELRSVAGGVKFTVEVEDAKYGTLRIVVHEKDDCSNLPAMSMGEPLNAGDVGSINLNKNGQGRLELVLPGVTLEPSAPNTLIGRSIVVHEGEKAGKTNQDYGRPLACGSIERS
jgi:Cu/Zn superoxide dismutase